MTMLYNLPNQKIVLTSKYKMTTISTTILEITSMLVLISIVKDRIQNHIKVQSIDG